MEIARDTALLQALREEVTTTAYTEPATGIRHLDIQKVVNLPLLTSAYSEALRLSMSFNVVRNVRESFTMDGYEIQKGAWVQVPTLTAHYDEDTWGVKDHPASEFWAERHIRYTEVKDAAGKVSRKRTFLMSGRSGTHYFPYGMSHRVFPCPLRSAADTCFCRRW
jgi:cytochrome P450